MAQTFRTGDRLFQYPLLPWGVMRTSPGLA
jgi:hypothetical protein